MTDISESDDFHDSNLLSLELDLGAQTLVVQLDAHLSQNNRDRRPILIRFSGVRTFSATADLADLRKHATFGNIAHWSPCEGFNLISLGAGAISFQADRWEISAATDHIELAHG